MIYLDHAAFKDIFVKGDSEKTRINKWFDWLGEFDLKLVYCLLTDQYIGLADGLSQIPTRILALSENRLGERMLMALMKVESRLVKVLEDMDFIL